MLPVKGLKSYGRNTQTAATVIKQLLEPRKGLFTHLSWLIYTHLGVTDHILTVMRVLGKTTIAAVGAASQAVVNLAANPGTYSLVNSNCKTADNVPSNGDYVVYQAADGTYVLDTISSISTLAFTLTTNLPTGGVLVGAPFWFFGIVGDTNPNDGQAHPRFNLLAPGPIFLGDPDRPGSICSSCPSAMNAGASGQNEPLVLISDNATTAGTLQCCGALYSNVG